MASISRVQLIIFGVILLIVVWVYLFYSLFAESSGNQVQHDPKYHLHNRPEQVIDVEETEVKSDQNENNSQLRTHEEQKIQQVGTVQKKPLDTKKFLADKVSVSRVYENYNQYFQAQPPPITEVSQNMSIYLQSLHRALSALAGPGVTPIAVWETFLNITREMPMTWDEQNRNRFPKPRKDESIFVSIGTYRDPFCPMTVKSLFGNAARPERVFVSLFQQNCFGPKCRTGVLAGGKVEEAGPDMDCYKEFCASQENMHTQACERGQIRLFNVNESESLGPYMARYLGAKFYRGEQYYLQIDSHSEFVQAWDNKLIQMVKDAPAEKPVISTYPPDSTQNWKNTIGFRMCDSEFASAQIEWQIIRLGSSMAFDHTIPSIPIYAPFVAAGFFFTYSDFLYEVPFDPFLPWIFMGEEISMSARLWTSGYDIFSPTVNVLNHYYVRRHYPKFWETVNRFFKKPIHNDILELIINRVKCMLGYPESEAERVQPASILYRLHDWGMGKKRSLKAYMDMVGLDMFSKRATQNKWCHQGQWPEIASQYRLHSKAK